MFDWQRYRAPLHRLLWEADPAALPPLKRVGVRLARVLYASVRDLVEGRLTLQAMGLVYTSLLSLVPLLAVSFSVLKAFGVHNQIEPFLNKLFAPLGADSDLVTARIIGFVEHIQVGVLGAVGLGFLIYTVISLLQKVEEAFNSAWRVAQPRSFAQRFSDYLSVITVGPVLVFAALGLTASFANAPLVTYLLNRFGLSEAAAEVARLLPYLLVIGAFTFAYVFIPNTKVRLRSALLGGVLAGVAWQTSGWAFAAFIAGSSKYQAIYSGFAIVIVFMLWLYLSWLILLLGAGIAFYDQHPEYVGTRPGPLPLSNRVKEKLALLAMSAIARRFYAGECPCTREDLVRATRMPAEALGVVLAAMQRAGLLVLSADAPPRYLPARALERVRLPEVLSAVRAAGEERPLHLERLPHEGHIDAILARLEQAQTTSLADLTVADLAREPERRA